MQKREEEGSFLYVRWASSRCLSVVNAASSHAASLLVGRWNVLVRWGGKGLAVATAAGILLSLRVIQRSREVFHGEGTRGLFQLSTCNRIAAHLEL